VVSIDPDGLTTITSEAGDLITAGDYAGGCAVATYVEPAHSTISGATWIWESKYVEDPQVRDSATFQKKFDLADAGNVRNIQLTFAVDNFYTVTLNGTPLASFAGSDDPSTGITTCNDAAETGCSFDEPVTIDGSAVSDHLNDGVNTLEVEVTNEANTAATNFEDNPAGVAYRLTIDTRESTTANQPPVAASTISFREKSFQESSTDPVYKFTLSGGGSFDRPNENADLSYTWRVGQITTRGEDQGVPVFEIVDAGAETTTFIVYDEPCTPSLGCEVQYNIDLTVSDGEFSDTDNDSSAIIACYDPAAEEFPNSCQGRADNDDNASSGSGGSDGSGGGGGGGGDPEITPIDGGGGGGSIQIW